MRNKILTGAAAFVAAGALSWGAAGMAGATGTATATGAATVATVTTAPPAHHGGRTLNCATAPKRLARIAKIEARTTTAPAKLDARAARAQAHGFPARAAFLRATATYLGSSELKTTLATRAQKIESVCHVSPPTTGTSTGSGSTPA